MSPKNHRIRRTPSPGFSGSRSGNPGTRDIFSGWNYDSAIARVTIRDDLRTFALKLYGNPMNHWLVKQEPEAYSWSDFVRDGKTAWTGVRNFQARNHLRTMQKGDAVLFYHSVSEKQVVGWAEVVKTAYPDPTAEEGDWSCVDLKPLRPLKQPVTLEEIKADSVLQNTPLIRQSRLSVMPLSREEFLRFLKLGKTPVK